MNFCGEFLSTGKKKSGATPRTEEPDVEKSPARLRKMWRFLMYTPRPKRSDTYSQLANIAQALQDVETEEHRVGYSKQPREVTCKHNKKPSNTIKDNEMPQKPKPGPKTKDSPPFHDFYAHSLMKTDIGRPPLRQACS